MIEYKNELTKVEEQKKMKSRSMFGVKAATFGMLFFLFFHLPFLSLFVGLAFLIFFLAGCRAQDLRGVTLVESSASMIMEVILLTQSFQFKANLWSCSFSSSSKLLSAIDLFVNELKIEI